MLVSLTIQIFFDDLHGREYFSVEELHVTREVFSGLFIPPKNSRVVLELVSSNTLMGC